MSDFKVKMHQIVCRLGLRPRPRWGSLQRSPSPARMGVVTRSVRLRFSIEDSFLVFSTVHKSCLRNASCAMCNVTIFFRNRLFSSRNRYCAFQHLDITPLNRRLHLVPNFLIVITCTQCCPVALLSTCGGLGWTCPVVHHIFIRRSS